MSNESNFNKKVRENEKEGYRPASPTKRALAWIGVFYMLIILGLTTFFYFTGIMLGNLQQLLIIPALIGAGALLIIRHRTEGTPSKRVACIGAIMFWIMALLSLPLGIIGLMSNFGG